MQFMQNLLYETIGVLKTNSVYPESIRYIGSRDFKYSCSWEEFKKMTKHARPWESVLHVASDLIIIGDTWLMVRVEFENGDSAWDFISLLFKEGKPMERVFKEGVLYPTLEELHTNT